MVHLPVPGDVRYLGRECLTEQRERPTEVRVLEVLPDLVLPFASCAAHLGPAALVETPRGECLAVMVDELHLDAAGAARDFFDPPKLEMVERFPRP